MAAPDAGTSRRPWVHVNCAVSLDGRLAFAGGRPARLSSPEDLRRVQRLRAESDGVVVGVGTVVKDDPSLRVHWDLLGIPPGREPVRVVLDGHGRTPPMARVLDGSAPTYVVTTSQADRSFPPPTRTIVAGTDRVDLATAFSALAEVGVRRLLVEGGAEVLSSVLREGRFDRLTVYYAPVLIGGRTAPPMVGGAETAGPEALRPLRLESLERLGDGFVATYLPPDPASRAASGSMPP